MRICDWKGCGKLAAGSLPFWFQATEGPAYPAKALVSLHADLCDSHAEAVRVVMVGLGDTLAEMGGLSLGQVR